MSPRDQFIGRLRLGAGGGRGIPVSFDLGPDQMPERNLRPGGDMAKGPHGETFATRRVESFEIKILAGRDSAKYAWKKVHPRDGGAADDTDGGGAEDGYYALEANGVDDVPENTIVTAWPSSIGPYLVFVYGGVTDADTRLARVYINDGTSGANTAAETDDGGYRGFLYTNNGDGTWTTSSTEVRVQLMPAAGGATFVNQRVYLCERNGSEADGRTVTDGVTTKDSATVTSATAAFTAADVGATISGTGIPGGATITVVGSSTSVTISAAATADGTSISLTITPTYPLYFNNGCMAVLVKVCNEADPEADMWDLWLIGESSCVIEDVDPEDLPGGLEL